MLTDGKGLNGGVVLQPRRQACRLPRHGRDGVSYDLFIAEPANNCRAPRLVYNGFRKNWSVQSTGRPTTPSYSMRNFVSANESHLYVMDIATAALTPVSEGSETARVSSQAHVHGRTAAASTSSPTATASFEQLRRVDLSSGAVEILTSHISVGHRKPSRAATTAAISPGWRTSMA